MYCLLCHEKISRIRHWRTKSEFCSDEHAAVHRRQTLERLVGHVAPSNDSDENGLAVLAGDGGEYEEYEDESDLPRASLDALEAAEALTLSEGAEASADTAQQASTQAAVSTRAGSLQTSEESEAEAEEAAAASTEDSFREADFDADQEPSAGEADDGEHYFEPASVQRDEPFPVEILTANAETDEEDLGLEAGEPIEPAASANVADPVQLLDLGEPMEPDAAGDSPEPRASEEGEIAPISRLDDIGSETAEELAQAIFERNRTPSATKQDAQQSESAAPAPTEPPHQAVEAKAETVTTDSDESPAEEPEPSKSAATAVGPAPEPKPAATASNESRPGVKSFGLKPVRAWDPTKGRVSGKKRAAGRPGAAPTGNAEGLTQLAEGIGERTKPRPTLSSEIRREDGRKPVMVCFLPVQGGNGASTVSLHVAEAISHHLNQRVLLADFDFHSGTLAFRLGLKPVHTLGDVFEWNQNKDQLWESAVCRWKKLDVLVAPPSNSSIHPHGLDRLPDIFGSALERYPYVIVDHPDAIYSSSRHILTLSDLVYLVCTPEITSLHLARRKVQQIRAMGVASERLRLIVNRAGSWGSLGVQDVGKIVGVPVSWALNNDYAALRDAVWNGGLVQDGSELAKQLRELGWSVMGVDAPVVAESAVPTEIGSTVG
jgi:MinD-like ATPase involved in chromosome partitioning or flagellar assembly